MHQLTTPSEEQRLLRTVPSAGEAALLSEVVELRAKNEQLEHALVSRAVIDQARGMVMALAPCSSERAWDVLVDLSQHCNIKLGTWLGLWSPRRRTGRFRSRCSGSCAEHCGASIWRTGDD